MLSFITDIWCSQHHNERWLYLTTSIKGLILENTSCLNLTWGWDYAASAMWQQQPKYQLTYLQCRDRHQLYRLIFVTVQLSWGLQRLLNWVLCKVLILKDLATWLVYTKAPIFPEVSDPIFHHMTCAYSVLITKKKKKKKLELESQKLTAESLIPPPKNSRFSEMVRGNTTTLTEIYRNMDIPQGCSVSDDQQVIEKWPVLRGGADKSLARPTSSVVGWNR